MPGKMGAIGSIESIDQSRGRSNCIIEALVAFHVPHSLAAARMSSWSIIDGTSHNLLVAVGESLHEGHNGLGKGMLAGAVLHPKGQTRESQASPSAAGAKAADWRKSSSMPVEC